MHQKTYPSDMNREQFEHVLPILDQARKRTKPRRVDMYEVLVRSVVHAAHRLPMASATQRLSEVTDRALVLCQVEG